LQGIELAVAQPIVEAFQPHFVAIVDAVEKSRAIRVTDPTDIDGIAAAHTLLVGRHRADRENVGERRERVWFKVQAYFLVLRIAATRSANPTLVPCDFAMRAARCFSEAVMT
jgi:hypothetical protein